MNKSLHLLIILGAMIFGFTLVMPGSLLAAEAKTNYNWYCAQCHGNEGKGDGVNATKDLPVAPRNLTNKADMEKFSVDQIFNTLTKGGPANNLSPLMPPFGNTLTTGERKALAKFVKATFCQC